jgi:chloride channel protein, CIC family
LPSYFLIRGLANRLARRFIHRAGNRRPEDDERIGKRENSGVPEAFMREHLAKPWKAEPRAGQGIAADLGDGHGSLVVLALLSLIAGVATGVAGAFFRLSLVRANRFRDALITWAHEEPWTGLLLVIVSCAAATAFAAWLVRRFSPPASGSGLPHVEAVLHEELPAAPFWLFPVKFIGGLLAIGAGLALGREGPIVQMGAALANLLGNLFRRDGPDCRVLLAAGAGAGLATAFNAPLAGAVFVLEELLRRFDIRTTIATFGASVGAIAVARVLLGSTPDFQVEPLPYPGFGTVPIYFVLGLLAGFLGVAYNHTILGTLSAMDRLQHWPVELRAAGIGAAVGLLAWFAPDLVGGGDAITQRTLLRTVPLLMLPLVFLLRFGLGAVSYAAQTPGGLFAPLLVLGAQSGLLYGSVCHHWFPDVVPNPTALAVVCMAAFFTSVVRAPVTGIILVTEMTGSFTLLLPLLGASFTAMLVPALLDNAPIYDSLRERTLKRCKRNGWAVQK